MKDVCTQTIWDHTEEELGMTMEKDFWRYVQVTTYVYQTPSFNTKTHTPTHGINGATKQFVHRWITS